VRWGTESLAAIARIKERAGEICLPLLLIHGGGDRVNSPDGTGWLHEHVGSKDKELRIYPKSYHEPHNDVEAERLFAHLIDWLGRHA
jgi:alpha-beta hydrolase superfamily lysophospholipase